MKDEEKSFVKNAKELYKLFSENEEVIKNRTGEGKDVKFMIREFVFSILEKNYSLHNKYSIYIQRLSSSFKNADEIKMLESKLTAEIYNKDKWFNKSFYQTIDKLI